MSSEKDRQQFLALERESRAITAKMVDVVKRRSLVRTYSKKGILSHFDNIQQDFGIWATCTSESLMVQLRRVVAEMAVVRRRIVEREDGDLGFQIDQEYHRKLQLLDTLKSITEFNDGAEIEYFISFEQAWRCDSQWGCLDM